MSTSPAFAATPRVGAVSVVTANTNRDGTGTIATCFTAGASGSKVEEIVFKATGDPADSVLVVYLHDGGTYYIFDEVDLGNPAAASTTVSGWRDRRVYENLVLPVGWSLRGSITVSLTSGSIMMIALGGDF